jgi:hypothetical protein
MSELDSVEACLRLDWAEQELEAKAALVADLQHHLSHATSDNADLRARVDTLKSVQETLLAEKLAAEASLEALLREKAELSGENASLRAHAKSLAHALAQHALVESAARAAGGGGRARSGSPRGGAEPGAPPAPHDASAAAAAAAAEDSERELRAARLLAVRLLDVARCGGWAAPGRSGAELWSALSQGTALNTSTLRGALVMALAEAAGVAAEMRAAAPRLPAAEPLPPPPAPPPAPGDDNGEEGGGGSGGGGGGASGPAEGGRRRGLFAAFFSYLVGDVEREREILAELREVEAAREDRARADRAAALALKKAIQEGAELGKEEQKQQLLLP